MINLKEVRKEAGYTQKQLADLLNISQQSYSDYENGRTFPDKKTLLKISEVLNISIDYLLGRTDELGAVAPSGAPLSADEKSLLENYRRLRPDLKQLLLSTAETLASSSEPDSVSKKKA